jgi:hypothetical protein
MARQPLHSHLFFPSPYIRQPASAFVTSDYFGKKERRPCGILRAAIRK